MSVTTENRATASPVQPDVEAPWHAVWRSFAANRVAIVGLVIFAAVIFVAIAAPLISPQNPYDLRGLSLLDSGQPPMSRGMDGTLFVLGTDDQGRDILSAIFYGLRISLIVAMASTAIAIAVGSVLGLLAVWVGGLLDAVIMRTVDVILSLPTVLVGLILLAVVGKGVDKVILALVIVHWAFYARLVRSTALIELGKDYIAACRSMGFSPLRIQLRHLLLNCLPPVLVLAPVHIGSAITLEATLSFLGVGVPITQPSLGVLISNGFAYLMSGFYWITVFPGIALFIAIASANIIGDQLRETFNPRSAR